MGRRVDRRDDTDSASTCNWPLKTGACLPAGKSNCTLRVLMRKRPCGCTVFQGVPRPVSKSAGHSEVLSTRLKRAAPPKPTSANRHWSGWAMQHSACNCSRIAPLKVGQMRQETMPGKAMLPVLPAPPVSTSRAAPRHTEPRACTSCNWPPLAFCTASASQRAGANSTSANNAPTSTPTAVQRHSRVTGVGPPDTPGTPATGVRRELKRNAGSLTMALTGRHCHDQHTAPGG